MEDCRGGPFGDKGVEGFGSHVGVASRQDTGQRGFATGKDCPEVALYRRRQLGAGQDRRVGLCHDPHCIKRDVKLEIHRLLGPERAVIVKNRDPVGFWQRMQEQNERR